MKLTANDFAIARKALGLSVLATSKETGISRADIARYEAGTYELKDIHLRTLERFYSSLGFDFESELNISEEIEKQENKQQEIESFIKKLNNEIVLNEEYKRDNKEIACNTENTSSSATANVRGDVLELDKAIKMHFKNRNVKTDFGFFFGESKQGRAEKLIALLAILKLRELATQGIDILNHQDFKLIRPVLDAPLGYESLAEFKDYNEFAII